MSKQKVYINIMHDNMQNLVLYVNYSGLLHNCTIT